MVLLIIGDLWGEGVRRPGPGEPHVDTGGFGYLVERRPERRLRRRTREQRNLCNGIGVEFDTE
ncbi:MAG: hypothetical protein J07HX64_00984 [halophilic archaeon J07HX64]|nr:MAG: hypothetical protein J07HX64_00984 [halophilic archaeon J07HX64]